MKLRAQIRIQNNQIKSINFHWKKGLCFIQFFCFVFINYNGKNGDKKKNSFKRKNFMLDDMDFDYHHHHHDDYDLLLLLLVMMVMIIIVLMDRIVVDNDFLSMMMMMVM